MPTFDRGAKSRSVSRLLVEKDPRLPGHRSIELGSTDQAEIDERFAKALTRLGLAASASPTSVPSTSTLFDGTDPSKGRSPQMSCMFSPHVMSTRGARSAGSGRHIKDDALRSEVNPSIK